MKSSRSRRYLLAAAVTAIFFLIGIYSESSVFTKILISAVAIAIAALHTETREGGMLSRLMYRYGVPAGQSHVVVIALSVSMVFVWLMLTHLIYTPFLCLFFVPIILAASRAGFRLCLTTGIFLFVALNMFFAFDPNGSERAFTFGLTFTFFFMLLSLVAGSLMSRLRRATIDLEALYETGKAIGASLRLEEILGMVVNIVYIDMAVEFCLIFLKDDATDTLMIAASRGIENEEALKSRMRIGEGVPGWVVKYAQPMKVDNLDSRQLDFLCPGIKSVIAAPLIIGGNPVGVLVAGKGETRFFGNEELEFLEALAGQTANAIRNANMYRETEQFAIRDGLTGSYNYRYFENHFAEQMLKASREDGGVVSLIMVDIDHFKKVNDTYGHPVGDKVLKSLARLLERNTRETDLVARYGGEEFVIVLPGARYEDAFRIATKLRQTVERASFLARERDITSLKITISLGAATYPTNASNGRELLEQADKALYLAKELRNTACSPLECEGPKVYAAKSRTKP